MTDRPPPIRVPCEGTGHPAGQRVGVYSGRCPACDTVVLTDLTDGQVVTAAHDRNDVTAMVARGDFDG